MIASEYQCWNGIDIASTMPYNDSSHQMNLNDQD